MSFFESAVLSRDYLSCLLQGTGQFISKTTVLLPVGKVRKQPCSGTLFNQSGTEEMLILLCAAQIQTHSSNLKLFSCYSRPLDLPPVEERGKEGKLCLWSKLMWAVGQHHRQQASPSTHAILPPPAEFPAAFSTGGVNIRRPPVTRSFVGTLWKE